MPLSYSNLNIIDNIPKQIIYCNSNNYSNPCIIFNDPDAGKKWNTNFRRISFTSNSSIKE